MLQPFWLSAADPLAASPVADAVLEHGLVAGLRLSAEIRRKVLALAKTLNAVEEPSRFLLELRRLLQRYEPALARTLSDAALLAWLRGGRRVAQMVTLPRHGTQWDKGTFPGLLPGSPPPWEPAGPAVGADDDEPETDLVLIREAAADLNRRQVLTPLDYAQADSATKQRSFTVARLTTEGAVAKVKEALVEAVEEGTTLKAFRERLAKDVETSSLGDGQVEAVFRTGVLSSYANGAEKIRESPLVKSALPFVETVPIRDSRLTEICRIAAESGLDGTGVYYADDSEWKRTRPLRHWNCRCGTIYMPLEMAAAKGVKVARRWLDSGVPPPTQSLYVPRVPIEMPEGWTR